MNHEPAKQDTAAAAAAEKQGLVHTSEIQNTMNHEPAPQSLETASIQESSRQHQAAVLGPPSDAFPDTLIEDVDMTATEQQPTSIAVPAASVDNVEADLEKQLYEDIVRGEQEAVMRGRGS